MTLISDIYTLVRNNTLNAMGVERDLAQLLADKDIGKVKTILQNRDTIVEKAMEEYYPSKHAIHNKMDKARSGKDGYRTEKLPRARQRYINEVELFFLFGGKIKWSMKDGQDADAFEDYKEYIKSLRLDSLFR